MYTKILPEWIDDIIIKYTSGKYSFKMLGEEYNVSYNCIRNLLKKNGVNGIRSRYTLDEHYFDIIDTEEKAYFLGLMYSDGNISSSCNTIKLSLEEGDKEILIKFAKALNSNKPIYFCKRSKPHHKDMYRLAVTSPLIKKALVQKGCHPNKTFTLKFPTEDQVPKHLLRHWLRGMWDGDGTFTMGFSNKIKRYRRGTAALIGTLELCNGVKSYILNEIGINFTISFPKSLSKTTRRLASSCGLYNFYRFLNWLYGESNISLKRKEDKFFHIQKTMFKEGKLPFIDIFDPKYALDSNIKSLGIKYCGV